MDLTESSIKLTWAPGEGEIVLVDLGDPMWEEVTIDGGQDIEEQARYRAAGIIAQPRWNERTSIRFVLARETAGPAEALEAALDAATAWPRGRADVLLELANGKAWTVYNAACRSWPAGTGEEHISREGLEIIGGEIVQTADAE